MPIWLGKDDKGCFVQWGKHGKKYYYKCDDENEKRKAIEKAGKQAQAAYAQGHRE